MRGKKWVRKPHMSILSVLQPFTHILAVLIEDPDNQACTHARCLAQVYTTVRSHTHMQLALSRSRITACAAGPPAAAAAAAIIA
jgi:hypothetical protein